MTASDIWTRVKDTVLTYSDALIMFQVRNLTIVSLLEATNVEQHLKQDIACWTNLYIHTTYFVMYIRYTIHVVDYKYTTQGVTVHTYDIKYIISIIPNAMSFRDKWIIRHKRPTTLRNDPWRLYLPLYHSAEQIHHWLSQGLKEPRGRDSRFLGEWHI